MKIEGVFVSPVRISLQPIPTRIQIFNYTDNGASTPAQIPTSSPPAAPQTMSHMGDVGSALGFGKQNSLFAELLSDVEGQESSELSLAQRLALALAKMPGGKDAIASVASGNTQPLPKVGFTDLSPRLQAFCLATAGHGLASAQSTDAWMLSQSLETIWSEYGAFTRYICLGTEYGVFMGRLLSIANTRRGGSRNSRSVTPSGAPERRVILHRLPEVVSIHTSGPDALFALTLGGLYAWGESTDGHLGVGVGDGNIYHPTRVPFTNIPALQSYEDAMVEERRPMELTFEPHHRQTFIHTPFGLIAAGDNNFAHLGVGEPDLEIVYFALVRLPLGINADQLTHTTHSLYTLVDGALYVCGNDTSGRFGAGVRRLTELTMLDLPFKVVSFLLDEYSATYYGDDRRVYICGKPSVFRAHLPNKREEYHTPTPLPFPWPAAKFVTSVGSNFVKRADTREWYACGHNIHAKLGTGRSELWIADWAPVTLSAVKSIHITDSATYFASPTGMLIAGKANGIEYTNASHTSLVPIPAPPDLPPYDAWALADMEEGDEDVAETRSKAPVFVSLDWDTVYACLIASGASPAYRTAVWFLSKDVHEAYGMATNETNDIGHWLVAGPRVFLLNLAAGLTVGGSNAYRRVPLPPVTMFSACDKGALAVTTCGLYVVGRNTYGNLGIEEEFAAKPTRVLFSGAPEVAEAEKACHRGQIHAIITGIHTNRHQTFIATTAGVVAAGLNQNGSLAVDSDEWMVKSFLPVPLPDDIAWADLRFGPDLTYGIQGNTIFVAGCNIHGRLGLGHSDPVKTLTPIPRAGRTASWHYYCALFLRFGAVFMSGWSPILSPYLPGGRPTHSLPAPLSFPWPVSRFSSATKMFFAQRADTDEWYALGNNARGQLGVGATDAIVKRWRPIPVMVISKIHISDDHLSVWFRTHAGVFAAGENTDGRLGVESKSQVVLSPEVVMDKSKVPKKAMYAWKLEPKEAPPKTFEGLSAGVTWAIMVQAGISPEVTKSDSPTRSLWFLSHRLNEVLEQSLRYTSAHTVGGEYGETELRDFAGRLFTRGENSNGRAGTRLTEALVTEYTRVRLPRVVSLHFPEGDQAEKSGSVFAVTHKGLFAWGSNLFGQLGLGSPAEIIATPTRVRFESEIQAAEDSLGAHDKHDFIDSVRLGYSYTMVETAQGVVASGDNASGILSVDSDEIRVISFKKMYLPPDIRFSKYQHGISVLYALKARALFVSGMNSHGRFGSGDCENFRRVRQLSLGIPVDDVTWGFKMALYLSDGRIFIVGHAPYLAAYLPSPGAEGPTWPQPAPLSFPWPADKFMSNGSAHFAREADTGQWYALGFNFGGLLGVGSTDTYVSEWTPVRVKEYVTGIAANKVSAWFMTEGEVYQAGSLSETTTNVPVETEDAAPAPLKAWELAQESV
ncbi:Regulator of chromosome condensation (RCC1) repeat [Carpediemonas membranifera]|uniref:Regulator of chromosome condensation (RCC1) repeat n=1 Tax=Carpediemonas membranifera TaxID=201153 RepID=A0A8J6E285_9EUKA|nr:Regulator of chromosome condensation (RCC1) repeat [Carpediemonas membranifera]|eukprot:KAG9394373.1 Regulator of chromosome condensation (RCC1) repeat [Carpediemonas membranifera]